MTDEGDTTDRTDGGGDGTADGVGDVDENGRSDDEGIDRRSVLLLAGLLGLLGGAGVAAQRHLLAPAENASTSVITGTRAAELADQFAPTLVFDAGEKWYPTDPRPYTDVQDGQTVVDGFDAFDGYVQDFAANGGPPSPTVFHRALQYDGSSLGVVQYWLYSAFDQFTTNFHWHDWEVLHVFVDLDSDEPVLLVASAHSRSVPNNEYLDPETDAHPTILAELGSHSSALSVNDQPASFQRLSIGSLPADVTNQAATLLAAIADVPMAYGLPRGEGLALPYLVPQLEGVPVYEHLPSVTSDDLIDSALTVSSFADLASPPSGLPTRSTGLVFGRPGTGDLPVDVEYDLVPAADLEHIEAYTGPRLGFEFSIPGFVENLVAKHVTTADVPWHQDRYDDPATDVSDAVHRSTLADRYDVIAPPGPVGRVVAAVRQTVQNASAPAGAGLALVAPAVETVALLASEPAAVPTFRGVVAVEDVDPGEHRLTVNGAGYAPWSERVTVERGGTVLAGADGQVAVVANEHAVKLRIDGENVDERVRHLAVEDDFAGRIYDAPASGRSAVYVHHAGAYTVEVIDDQDAVGAHRVTPVEGDEAVTVARPGTGKAVLAGYLETLFEETRADVATYAESTDQRTAPVDQLATSLATARDDAGQAGSLSTDGERASANDRLRTVAGSVEELRSRLDAAAADLTEPLVVAVRNRLDQASRRVEQAIESEKL